MNHFEIEGALDNLFESDPWGEWVDYPVADWKYEVANNDTRLGYRSWLYNKLANED